MHNHRLGKLRALLAEHNMDALLVTNAVNRQYMSGFTGSSGVLLITADKALLYSDFRYRTQAPGQAPSFEFIEHQANVMDAILESAVALHLPRIAFEAHDMSFETYSSYVNKLQGIELIPAGKWVEQLRMVKGEAELVIMREAALLADKTFNHIVGLLKPGMRELDIALEMEFYMRHHGATSSSFETIVASGERSALPHGVASDRILQYGEYVKLDFGAYYQGYCSDITRTVMLGRPTDRHRDIYQIVLEAQQATLEQIRPGMTGREADAIARNIITKHGYGDLFGHGTGHGLGMEIHESPRLSLTGDTVLEPGMTVTVEPGIYIAGFGGVRIEDDVVITSTGVDILTHATKDFIVID
ncbi:MAG: Xaa-Pro peptidase family protein [Paenibacillaceae bacterium]